MKLLFTILFAFSISMLSLAQSSSPYTQHESIGISPTAFSLQAGEKRITTTWGVINNFTHGITDKFSYSLAAGFGPKFTFGGLARTKYTQDLAKYVRVGFSSSVFIFPDVANLEFDFTGIATLGSHKNYINFSYSRFYSKEEAEWLNRYSVGFRLSLSKNFSFSSDSIISTEHNEGKPELIYIQTLILKYSFLKRHQLSFGPAVIFTEYGDFFPAQILSYSFYWGEKKMRKLK